MIFQSIITSEAQFNRHVPSNVALDFTVVENFLVPVQQQYIESIVSTEQLELLITSLDAQDELSQQYKTLIELAQAALSYLVLIEAIPHLNINAKAGGFSVNVSEGTQIASKWRVNQLIQSIGRSAQRALDSLIEYLDANRDSFTGYKNSETEQRRFTNFIQTSKQFNQSCQLNLGGWILESIRPTIDIVEETVIRPIICDDLYDDMKSKIKARESLGDYAPLVPHIQRIVANYTAMELMAGTTVTVDQTGVYRRWTDQEDDLDRKKPADGGERETSLRHFERSGQRSIELLRAELVKNISNYPLYAESSCYTSTETKSITPSTTGGIFPGFGV